MLRNHPHVDHGIRLAVESVSDVTNRPHLARFRQRDRLFGNDFEILLPVAGSGFSSAARSTSA
jgi:hypothetical protein